jgi:hypothetical protein
MKKALLILLILFCAFFFSKKVQAQNRHHRPNFYVNIYRSNNVFFPSMQPMIYIVNQYSVYLNTVYYVDRCGFSTGHGYSIYRYYTCYSNGMVTYVDGYTYF